MTKKEFDFMYFGKAVHCKNFRTELQFLKLADSVGYKYPNGANLQNPIFQVSYPGETCYEVTKNGVYAATLEYYRTIEKREIVKFKMPVLKDEQI